MNNPMNTTDAHRDPRRTSVVLLALCFSLAVALTAAGGCGTMEGAGEDVEDAGEGVQDAADG